MREALAVTWLGHSTALIELDGTRVLTDPVLRDRVGPLVRIGARVDRASLRKLDAVAISHLHADHADPASLRMLDPKRVFAPRGSRRWLSQHVDAEVEELAAGEQAELGDISLRATAAAHQERRWPLGAVAHPIGLVLEGSQSCYFAGDTGLYPGMAELSGLIDLALLPVWGWGSSVGPGHLDPVTAADAVRLIGPRAVVPIHWGTFTPMWRAWRRADPALPARRFKELVEQATPDVEVRLLVPGERTDLRRSTRSAGDGASR